MKVFELKGGIPQITAEVLLVKEFSDLWERDNDRALKEFKFIYLANSYSFDNPFRGYSPEIKEQKVIENVFDSKWKLDAKVRKAVDKFNELQNSSVAMRLYIAALSAIDMIIEYFTTVDFTLTDDKGKPIHDINKLTKTLEGTSSILKSLKELEDRVKAEEYDSNRTKKDRSVNAFEI